MTTVATCCRCGQTFMAPATYYAAWCSPDCELDALSAPDIEVFVAEWLRRKRLVLRARADGELEIGRAGAA